MTKEELKEMHLQAWMSYFHPSMDEERDIKNLQEYLEAQQWVFENSPIQRVELRKDGMGCFLRLALEDGVEVDWNPRGGMRGKGKFGEHSDGIGRCIASKWTADDWTFTLFSMGMGCHELEIVFDAPIESSGDKASQLVASRSRDGVVMDCDYWRGFSPGSDDRLRNRLWEYLMPFCEESKIIGDVTVSACIEPAANAAVGEVADND